MADASAASCRGFDEPASVADSLDGLTHALRLIGTDSFYPAVVRWVEAMIPNDFYFVAHYSRDSKPMILHDTWSKSDAKDYYFANVCEFDPVFVALGNDMLMPGTSLSVIGGQFGIDRRYADYLQNVAHIADELMILLPRSGDGCTAVCLDRENAHFTTAEITYARSISALLLELDGIHRERLRAPGHALLPATAAAIYLAAQAPEPQPPAPSARFLAAMQRFARANGLTPREAEITSLSLQGYPTGAIAKALGIGQGSIKNHKLRLYRKLDITSERELFPLFLDLALAQLHA